MNLLFIGNSHTYYNDMPLFVRDLLEATGQKSHVTMLTQGGKALTYHTQDKDVLFNLRYGRYDTAILQDKATDFDPVLFREGAAKLLELAKESSTPVLLYMPWAAPGDKEGQRKMTDAYHSFATEHNCPFAPAGEVLSRVLLTEKTEDFYHEDKNHLRRIGSYLAAVTVFYALTKRKRVIDPQSIADPGIAAGFPIALCRKIHADACRTVRLYNG